MMKRKNRNINSKRGKWKGINEAIRKKKKTDDKRRTKPYNIHNKLQDIDMQICGKMKS